MAPMRAPYACDPAKSRGRHHPQPESAMRSAFQRDRDRIIHSSAFRRLKEKTQVFVAHEGDAYRTRLTHSLEVSQIARTLARALQVDEDLAEASALAHDLGHPPFGHSGEDALSESMVDFGGFDHNAQTLRVVTKLETRYPEFEGLNLAWETLEGVVKHNGPLMQAGDDPKVLPWGFRAYPGWQALELHTHAGIEGQIAALSDDIAYNNHDIDDGLRSGILKIEQLMDLPLVGDVFRRCRARYPDISENILIHEAVREMIGLMVADVLDETRRRLKDSGADSPEAVRRLDRPMVSFSDGMTESLAAVRRFLYANMYLHYKVKRMKEKGKMVVRDLFAAFLSDPMLLPTELQREAGGAGEEATARVVCDYIAGMTDRYAIEEHRKLFHVEGWG
ncbi:MAG: deoxyguanosinetriphosphate triphosphohydrolase [Oceanicaulis sp.]|jgi:dGTPase|uniref:deoxyguanosinetriphosphate triphosphohydrolase n=1 Tax=unclassified Oceanicaulis TaxID=2632123 RepID=UPI000C440F2D|nr:MULTISPECIES: deoxyguanosinetriphosphate triphosphohydrolase [unclassified Oceanicaulis]MAB70276.1 deoxyguanosinetriphosphate triphosphohydrolase [Oceanicaulis sp.]MBC39011.1 deoxyguanosinetriphosphate triphosphohydrolase [Oceanicaulis sp.]MBG34735.1 deoxyguanosinetriphosphate triphosphohydrolase [Oceanicaulis sp.]HCR94120.1 deoxyguanosinetriphosphate triphosphohydrolase [Oceanicaulis sp.]|tara:strand:+ start:1142 stop:2317 length:1176 start_codon:yes stop_codon:yes gene_type:complete